MRSLSGGLAYLAIMLAAFGIFSYLPHAGGNDITEGSTPRARAVTGEMDSSNLVDYLAPLPLRLKLASAKLEYRILQIDLQTEAAVDSGSVYRDLYRLCSMSFGRTRNIDKLLVRVFDAREGTESFILAMEASRDRWPANEAPMSWDSTVLLRHLNRHTSLTSTPEWRDLTEPASSRSPAATPR